MIFFGKRKFKGFIRAVALSVVMPFIGMSVVPVSYAQGVAGLPVPGAMVNLTASFTPAIVMGVNIYPDNPLKFDFIIDKGDSGLDGKTFDEEVQKLIKYFLASLTIPEDEMWVNLSPYEKNRIIPSAFGKTEMGRDLLALDYMLKQLSSSLMNPKQELGSAFWDRVYKKAQEMFGTTDIPMNTFNKIWIIPEKAMIYEHEKGAFIVDSHLKVMLEEDYLALEANKDSTKHGLGNVTKDDLEVISGVSGEVVREVLIPEIEKEVNEGKTFAKLRQIYNSMLLASWYKKALKESLLGKTYVDQEKVHGIDMADTEDNQKIYSQYVEAFKKGVFDFIKEDYDPTTQEIIPRKYFSGGVKLNGDQSMISESDTKSKPKIKDRVIAAVRRMKKGVKLTFGLNSTNFAEEGQAVVSYENTSAYKRMLEGGDLYTRVDLFGTSEQIIAKSINIIEHKGISIEKYLEGKTILVVGFGDKWQELEIIAKKFSNSRVIGIDWLERNIDKARENISSENIELEKTDIRKLDPSKYGEIGMSYLSYVIDSRLYDRDDESLKEIVEKVVGYLAPEGFFVNVPSHAIVWNVFKNLNMETVYKEDVGLGTVFIGRKQDISDDQKSLALDVTGIDGTNAKVDSVNSNQATEFEKQRTKDVLEILKDEGFKHFSLNDVEKMSSQSQTYYDQEISGLMISPLTNKVVSSKLWKIPKREGVFSDFNNALRTEIVEAGIFERIGVESQESLWIDDRFVPIAGGEVYRSDGNPLTDDELETVGLRKVRNGSGEHVKIKMLEAGNRVFDLPGPWIVPYVKEGEGVRLLTTLNDIRGIYQGDVSYDNLSDVLAVLVTQGKIQLKTAAALEYKGVGAYRTAIMEDLAPNEGLKALVEKTAYIPGLNAQKYGSIANGGFGVPTGIGSLNANEASAVDNDAQLNSFNAVLLGETVASYKLFDSKAFEDLKDSPSEEAWYSLRMVSSTVRSGAYMRMYSSGKPVTNDVMLLTFLEEMYGNSPKEELVEIFIANLLSRSARNIRATRLGQKKRESSSNTPDNYGPFLELIDTGSDSLKDFDANDRDQLSGWVYGLEGYFFIFDSLVTYLAREEGKPYDSFDYVARHDSFKQQFLSYLLKDQELVDQAYEEYMSVVDMPARYSDDPSAMDYFEFMRLMGKYLEMDIKKGKDESMLTKGGIDLNPSMADMDIESAGNAVRLSSFSGEEVEDIDINGFVPVIINIVPASNVLELIGLN